MTGEPSILESDQKLRQKFRKVLIAEPSILENEQNFGQEFRKALSETSALKINQNAEISGSCE